MTVSELLERLSICLVAPGVPPARADARDLMAAVLRKPRLWPGANPTVVVAPAKVNEILAAAARLEQGMPMQYAVGTSDFRHLTLLVDGRVLIPRPETEVLVDIVLAEVAPGGTVADVGTGSGAIAIALATEGRFDRVIATDISSDALDVARANLAALTPGATNRTVVELRQGDLAEALRGERLRALVSNPPYIARVEEGDLPAAVRDWEPPLALFSEEGGMAAIFALVRAAPDVLEPGGLLVLEIDSRRAALARDAANAGGHFRAVGLRLDLTGRERFLVARL